MESMQSQDMTPEERIAELQEILVSVRQQADADRSAFQLQISDLQTALQTSSQYAESLEQRVADTNNLRAQLSDMEQERDRLRSLLLGIVPDMEAFSVEYPQASVARTAFNGASPAEVAEKMAVWDAARAHKISEWGSLVNNVRTQATV